LAEVRAVLAYGEDRGLTGVEMARWRERLHHDSGLLAPRPTPDLPSGLSASGVAVGEGWRLLVGLRGLLREEQWCHSEPFKFARDFVMAWCGVSNEQAKVGVRELERVGVLVRVKRTYAVREPIDFCPGWWELD
jgi:hypothetical protein